MPGSSIMESSKFLLLFLLGYCLAVIEGELRCYCNESGCVSTGYMCKSSAGQCFTALEVRGEATHQTHGCLDSLPKEKQASCKVGVELISTSKTDLTTGHLPFLLCCKEHMCNYREDIDISIILTPKYNGTFHRGSAPVNDDFSISSRNHHSNREDDRDLWFKAAVIAVPIAGGFILVLLVLLAVRMLRTDTRHHRRLIHIRRERSLTKADMYISEHYSNKVNKQHFSLFHEKARKISHQQCPDNTTVNSNNSNSHSCVGPCQSSCITGSSSSCCSYSLHNESSHKSDNSAPRTNSSNHYHTSMPCNLSHISASHVTCSSNGDNHSRNNVKPCSFLTDLSSETPCLTKDITVKVDKDCHMFSHATRPDSYGGYSGPCYKHPSVASLDKACLTGPTAVV